MAAADVQLGSTFQRNGLAASIVLPALVCLAVSNFAIAAGFFVCLAGVYVSSLYVGAQTRNLCAVAVAGVAVAFSALLVGSIFTFTQGLCGLAAAKSAIEAGLVPLNVAGWVILASPSIRLAPVLGSRRVLLVERFLFLAGPFTTGSLLSKIVGVNVADENTTRNYVQTVTLFLVLSSFFVAFARNIHFRSFLRSPSRSKDLLHDTNTSECQSHGNKPSAYQANVLIAANDLEAGIDRNSVSMPSLAKDSPDRFVVAPTKRSDRDRNTSNSVLGDEIEDHLDNEEPLHQWDVLVFPQTVVRAWIAGFILLPATCAVLPLSQDAIGMNYHFKFPSVGRLLLGCFCAMTAVLVVVVSTPRKVQRLLTIPMLKLPKDAGDADVSVGGMPAMWFIASQAFVAPTRPEDLGTSFHFWVEYTLKASIKYKCGVGILILIDALVGFLFVTTSHSSQIEAIPAASPANVLVSNFQIGQTRLSHDLQSTLLPWKWTLLWILYCGLLITRQCLPSLARDSTMSTRMKGIEIGKTVCLFLISLGYIPTRFSAVQAFGSNSTLLVPLIMYFLLGLFEGMRLLLFSESILRQPAISVGRGGKTSTLLAAMIPSLVCSSGTLFCLLLYFSRSSLAPQNFKDVQDAMFLSTFLWASALDSCLLTRQQQVWLKAMVSHSTVESCPPLSCDSAVSQKSTMLGVFAPVIVAWVGGFWLTHSIALYWYRQALVIALSHADQGVTGVLHSLVTKSDLYLVAATPYAVGITVNALGVAGLFKLVFSNPNVDLKEEKCSKASHSTLLWTRFGGWRNHLIALVFSTCCAVGLILMIWSSFMTHYPVAPESEPLLKMNIHIDGIFANQGFLIEESNPVAGMPSNGSNRLHSFPDEAIAATQLWITMQRIAAHDSGSYDTSGSNINDDRLMQSGETTTTNLSLSLIEAFLRSLAATVTALGVLQEMWMFVIDSLKQSSPIKTVASSQSPSNCSSISLIFSHFWSISVPMLTILAFTRVHDDVTHVQGVQLLALVTLVVVTWLRHSRQLAKKTSKTDTNPQHQPDVWRRQQQQRLNDQHRRQLHFRRRHAAMEQAHKRL